MYNRIDEYANPAETMETMARLSATTHPHKGISNSRFFPRLGSMKPWLQAVAAFLCGVPLFGGATIEGTVPLTSEATAPASGERYQIKSSAAVGKPDPVQAVVYLEGDFPKGTAASPHRGTGSKTLSIHLRGHSHSKRDAGGVSELR